MSDLRVVLIQTRFAILATLRTRRTIFFTLLIPLILLVIFSSLFGNGAGNTVTLSNGATLDAEAYFTAGIIAYATALSTFTTLTVVLTTKRESGQLKRYRGTPMPAWTFISAWILRALLQVTVAVVLLMSVAVVAYGVEVPSSAIPGLAVYVVLGTASLCALAFAMTVFTPTVDSASTIAPFGVVILSFVSGVWFPVDQLPNWAADVGRVFPLAHLASGLQTALSPATGGIGLNGSDVAALAVWGLAGIVVAARRFKWEPQTNPG